LGPLDRRAEMPCHILYTKPKRIQASCEKSGPGRWMRRTGKSVRRGGLQNGAQKGVAASGVQGDSKKRGSADVERLGAGRLTRAVERDLLDAGFGLAQQLLAAALERFAALVDRHRFLERDVAPLELLHDGFELGERLLERQLRHVGIIRHRLIPKLESVGHRYTRCRQVGQATGLILGELTGTREHGSRYEGKARG